MYNAAKMIKYSADTMMFVKLAACTQWYAIKGSMEPANKRSCQFMIVRVLMSCQAMIQSGMTGNTAASINHAAVIMICSMY